MSSTPISSPLLSLLSQLAKAKRIERLKIIEKIGRVVTFMMPYGIDADIFIYLTLIGLKA